MLLSYGTVLYTYYVDICYHACIYGDTVLVSQEVARQQQGRQKEIGLASDVRLLSATL